MFICFTINTINSISQSFSRYNYILHNDYLLNPADITAHNNINIDILGSYVKNEYGEPYYYTLINSNINLQKIRSSLRVGIYNENSYSLQQAKGGVIGFSHHLKDDELKINIGANLHLLRKKYHYPLPSGTEEDLINLEGGISLFYYGFYFGTALYQYNTPTSKYDSLTDTRSYYFEKRNMLSTTIRYTFNIKENFKLGLLTTYSFYPSDFEIILGILGEYKEKIGLGMLNGRISAYYCFRDTIKIFFYYQPIYGKESDYKAYPGYSAQLQFRF